MKLIISAIIAALVIGFILCMAIFPYGIHKRPPQKTYVTWPSMRVFSYLDSLSGRWPRFIKVGSGLIPVDSQTPVGELPVCEYEASFENIYWINGVRYTNPATLTIGYQGLLNYAYVDQDKDSVVVISQPSSEPQKTPPVIFGIFAGTGLSTDLLPYPEAVGLFNYRRFLLLTRGGFYPEHNVMGELRYAPKLNAGIYLKIL